MDPDPSVSDGELALFGDGGLVEASTESGPARFLLFHGKPLGEPVAWRGPIVMNTREELQQAFEDLESGKFIRHKTR